MTRPELIAACVGGISFTAEGAQKTHDREKTHTMRVMKPQPYRGNEIEISGGLLKEYRMHGACWEVVCDHKPRYKPGDILYVREPWKWIHIGGSQGYLYQADELPGNALELVGDWNPADTMPIKAARSFIRIIGVEATRLRDNFLQYVCSAIALQEEGFDIGDDCRTCIDNYGEPCCRDGVDNDGSTIGACGLLDDNLSGFEKLWDDIHKEDLACGSKQNPWCWGYTYEVLRCEG